MQSRTHGLQEKKSGKVHAELNILATKLGLPVGVREESERLAADLVAKKLVDRVSPTVIAAASLHKSCRDSQIPVTLRELASASGCSQKEIGRCYRRIMTEMELGSQAIDAALYATRVAERAHISERAANLSAVIARKAVEKGFEGMSPVTLAAAAVYTASLMMGEAMTQSEAAEAAGVGEVSVRRCAKAIRGLTGTF